MTEERSTNIVYLATAKWREAKKLVDGIKSEASKLDSELSELIDDQLNAVEAIQDVARRAEALAKRVILVRRQ